MATATAPGKLERTEDQILSQAPIEAKFGDKVYQIKPLRILAARKWREQLIEQVKAIAGEMSAEAGSSDAFIGGLAFTFLKFPEKMADLVFSYAPDLPREVVEEEATEEQLARVFGQIVQVAFPFVGELRLVTQTLGLAASFPASAKSTR